MFRAPVLMIGIALMIVAAAIVSAASPVKAVLSRGETLMQAERYEEAAEQFERALKMEPASQTALRNLAICRFQLRNYDAAAPLFLRIAGDPAGRDMADYYLGRIALIQGELDAAVSRLQPLARRRASDPFQDEELYLGIAEFKRLNYTRAADAFRRCSERNVRDFRCHQWLGRAAQKLGRDAEATREFDKSRELYQYYAEGSAAIGECRGLLIQNKAAEAWDRCGPLLATDDVDKLVAIGILFGRAGDYSHSLQVWQRAAALDPDSPEIQHNLAFTYYQLRDLASARKHAALAVSLLPDFADATVLYGMVLYLLRDDRNALAVLTRAHQLRPDDAGVNQLLSELQTHAAAPR